MVDSGVGGGPYGKNLMIPGGWRHDGVTILMAGGAKLGPERGDIVGGFGRLLQVGKDKARADGRKHGPGRGMVNPAAEPAVFEDFSEDVLL